MAFFPIPKLNLTGPFCELEILKPVDGLPLFRKPKFDFLVIIVGVLRGGGGAEGNGGGGSQGKGGGGEVGSGGRWADVDLGLVHSLDAGEGAGEEANVDLKAAGDDFCSVLSELK